MKRSPNIVIVGGGTAGWMTAAALAKVVGKQADSITLIESDRIGTVGVGEATIPHLRYFNNKLGINEHDFIKATNATYKLGIEFVNWGKIGDSYIHPFGEFGAEKNGVSFHHYWRAAQDFGDEVPIFDYSLPVAACKAGRFDYPSKDKRSIYSTYAYAFHIDASQYAKYLQNYSANLDVKRIEGKITHVTRDKSSGDILSVELEDNRVIEGDLFIDCSGFKSLLLQQELEVEFEDWSHWLKCDRAVAVPCESPFTPPPYTQATAQKAGWQWKIPLQHRTGNGYVYCSDHISADEATQSLLNNLEGAALADPNYIKFKAGRYKQGWKNNCIAIGLSSGFLEPLESTSIYLIQAAIMSLIEYFPAFDSNNDVLRDEYNRQMQIEYDRIRDFLILHYHATEREDSPFWQHCKNMEIPESLQFRMQAFQENGYVDHYDQGLFLIPSWIAVYLGQGITPKGYHPNVSQLPPLELLKSLAELRKMINNATDRLPTHQQSLNKHIAEKSPWPPSAMSLYGVFS